MNGVLGGIQLGAWELGSIGATPVKVEFQAVDPAFTIVFSGGTPIKTFTSILGVISLGKFELGQISNVNSQVLFGKGNFVATASPVAIFSGETIPLLTFVATAEPILIIGVGVSFVASADPRLSIMAVIPPSFIATASPQMKVFPLNYQQQGDLVPGPITRTIKLVNYVY
jgi:hypothetical protein